MVNTNVRGGGKIRRLVAKSKTSKIERYACPVCMKNSVRNVSFAVWRCNSCESTFAGGAYALNTAPGSDLKRRATQLQSGK